MIGVENLEQKINRDTLTEYLESITLLEKLHRLLLGVVKDEFERNSVTDINPVQALLLYNIGDSEIIAGELKSRGCYQGSNVTYNLKKLVGLGYVDHQRCTRDRRSVWVKLTIKGHNIRFLVADLFERHVESLQTRDVFNQNCLITLNDLLRVMERFWTDQSKYIY